jgi:hypothetical protein
MPASFRPALEPLENRCLPSASPLQSAAMIVVGDLQHIEIHGEIAANSIQTTAVQAGIREDQKVVVVLQASGAQSPGRQREIASLQSHIQAEQGTLSVLQQQRAVLATQDALTDAVSFVAVRDLFPGVNNIDIFG